MHNSSEKKSKFWEKKIKFKELSIALSSIKTDVRKVSYLKGQGVTTTVVLFKLKSNPL